MTFIIRILYQLLMKINDLKNEIAKMNLNNNVSYR